MPTRKWTVLTFIAAHNNLQSFGIKSMRQIAEASSTAEVALGVYLDSGQGAGKYVIGEAGTAAKQDLLGHIDSGDPEEVIKAAAWLFKAYPAERYALVLWSHGTGWRPEEIEQISREARPNDKGTRDGNNYSSAPGAMSFFRTTVHQLLHPPGPTQRAILFDDGSGRSLDTIELARVMRAIQKDIGQPIDLLGMDACLMANLEAAYELRDSVKLLVASEELVPAYSWPYKKIYEILHTNPQMSGSELAKCIVTEYLKFYQTNPPGTGDVTKVAIDITKLAALKEAVNALAEALKSDIDRTRGFISVAQTETKKVETKYDQRTPSKFDFDLWDLGSFARKLATLPKTPTELKNKANAVTDILVPGAGPILAECHVGQWFDQICGVSIYLPMPDRPISRFYSDLAFARETNWLAMLTSDHKAMA